MNSIIVSPLGDCRAGGRSHLLLYTDGNGPQAWARRFIHRFYSFVWTGLGHMSTMESISYGGQEPGTESQILLDIRRPAFADGMGCDFIDLGRHRYCLQDRFAIIVNRLTADKAYVEAWAAPTWAYEYHHPAWMPFAKRSPGRTRLVIASVLDQIAAAWQALAASAMAVFTELWRSCRECDDPAAASAAWERDRHRRHLVHQHGVDVIVSRCSRQSPASSPHLERDRPRRFRAESIKTAAKTQVDWFHNSVTGVFSSMSSMQRLNEKRTKTRCA